MMLDLAQTFPTQSKNTNTNHYRGEKTKHIDYTYIIKKKDRNRPIKKLTHIVYYKYQQRSLQR